MKLLRKKSGRRPPPPTLPQRVSRISSPRHATDPLNITRRSNCGLRITSERSKVKASHSQTPHHTEQRGKLPAAGILRRTCQSRERGQGTARDRGTVETHRDESGIFLPTEHTREKKNHPYRLPPPSASSLCSITCIRYRSSSHVAMKNGGRHAAYPCRNTYTSFSAPLSF